VSFVLEGLGQDFREEPLQQQSPFVKPTSLLFSHAGAFVQHTNRARGGERTGVADGGCKCACVRDGRLSCVEPVAAMLVYDVKAARGGCLLRCRCL
jgi:hypothetical protein